MLLYTLQIIMGTDTAQLYEQGSRSNLLSWTSQHFSPSTYIRRGSLAADQDGHPSSS